MNINKLKQAEETFLTRYPDGFDDPKLMEMAKKHKMEQMISFAQESFSKDRFEDTEKTIDNMIKLISRSSMVSMFEKPKFKNFAHSLTFQEQKKILRGIQEQLHGKEEVGFNMLLEIFTAGKLAKWPLMTILPNYFNPQKDVFVKPTTAKGVIEFFELSSLQYKPAPTWAFYKAYRRAINKMKSEVAPGLFPTNAAFSGFLMMSLEKK